ncbi:MAG: hypothetical protein RB148_04510 [Armatimonadota bacterium]|nr:hypothetical protein [Armatimonadota bacterium]MDR7427544.1 hypothetical protein [Armatimonadota bacterium]MDR7463446.1 hypothetical protein [Armatimonadota bacterium]MDR7469708.1 hypothetical protein [Armatimonadota bacterium]
MSGYNGQVLADASAPTLIIVANGPGEIGGWVLPISREVRGRAGGELRLLLVLPPSQFASGTEEAVARETGLFDQIVPPRRCLRLALGLDGLPLGRPAALLHLGGDLWFSRRLARRFALPAFAFAETPLVARYRRAFREIFVPSESVAALLAARGVEPDRLYVTGDPRLDHLPERTGDVRPCHPGKGEPLAAPGRSPHVVLLAGSRERVFRLLLPLWAQTAIDLRRLAPEAAATIAISPHLPDEAVEAVVAPWLARLQAEGVAVGREGTARAIADADLVLTIPGTTTMEVAAVPVAALVILPRVLADVVPFEGLLEWVLRLPPLGRLRRLIAELWARRQPYAALPNRLAGRAILPEVVGESPQQIAASAAALLRDESRRRDIEEALAASAGPRGAAARIAERVLAALLPEPAAAGA